MLCCFSTSSGSGNRLPAVLNSVPVVHREIVAFREGTRMRHLLAGLLALSLLVVAGVRADDEKKEDKKPSEQLKGLIQDAQKELRDVKTAEERTKILKTYSPKFMKFAQDNDKDGSAFTALYLCVQINAKESAKACEILAKDYAKDKKITAVVRFLGQIGADENGTKLLKAVLEKNEDKATQAAACLALAGSAEN